jgi:hypothetical protein
MLSTWEAERQWQARALALKAEAVTPAHSAAEGAMDADEAEDGEDAKRRRRERVQHEADPYLHEAPEVDCVDVAEAGKLRIEAVDVPVGYPPMRLVDAEQFRRGPATAGHAADSPGYAPPGRPVPVPSATLSPGMISRPPLGDGQARPRAPEAC